MVTHTPQFGKGVGLGEGFEFYDVWGLDEELLQFVPQPCYAVMLLYPVTEAGVRAAREGGG